MIGARWELLPHGADVGVCGIGRSKAQAFEQAGVALTAVVTDPGTVAAEDSVEISCAAPDDELLLVEWLNALIYEMATRKNAVLAIRGSHRRRPIDGDGLG